MPGKTAKSAPLAPFGLSGMTALVRAATPLARTRENRKNARKIGSHPGNPGLEQFIARRRAGPWDRPESF
jgi:hypothetical protein